MATKLDQSSPAESWQSKPTASPSLAPKLSIFGTKAGFVIPKNKLAGSLVIRGSSAKNETPTASKEENNKHVQRRTKWGPDLASEPAVCKGRALAYQTRVEQITKQLKSGALEIGKMEGSTPTVKGSNSDGTDNLKESEQGKLELLELERREIIGEILRLNPGYKAPDDYKPLLKETKIPLLAKAHPGHNVIGVLIGPESNTQKRLQEETGAIIRVYGTKKMNGEKNEICHPDIDEAQAAYEDLYISVSADSYDKVGAAVALIELLLAPVSVNSIVTSTTATVSSAVTSDAVNPADVQLMQSNTSQPGLLHFQTPWLSTPQTNDPSILYSGPVSSSLSNRPLQLQPPVVSFNILPYTGQPPHMNTMPRNPLPVPGPPTSMPNIQQPPPQFRANPPIGPPFGQPPGIVSLQPIPSSSVPPPVRPLQTPHASGGWPSFSPVISQSQRPPQASPTFMPMRPISVSPLGATPSQGPVALVPPSNIPTNYRSQHSPVANFTPATLISRPPGGAQSFPSVPPQGPSSMQILPFPAGASAQSPYPLSMQARPTMSIPDTVRGPPPAFSQVVPTPGMVPSSVRSSCPPASAPASTSCSQSSIGALRPPRPTAGDFTFWPVVSPLPTPDFPASTSQMGIHANTRPGLPHAPFFHPANHPNVPVQGFQRPVDGRPMGQPGMHAPPPHLPGVFPVGFRGIPPAGQPGGRILSPPMPPPSNVSSFLPSRPFQFMPPPHQNPFPNTSRQGENPGGANPIYDPFAPTAASGAKKTEADPEYEDLMASVGMK